MVAGSECDRELDCAMLLATLDEIVACDVDDDKACKRRRCSTATVCASSDKEQDLPDVQLLPLLLVPDVLPIVKLDLPDVVKLLL